MRPPKLVFKLDMFYQCLDCLSTVYLTVQTRFCLGWGVFFFFPTSNGKMPEDAPFRGRQKEYRENLLFTKNSWTRDVERYSGKEEITQVEN